MRSVRLTCAFYLAVFCAVPIVFAQRFHGMPASVTSPGFDGRLHGIPASVTSPTFDGQFGNGFSGIVTFGHVPRGFVGFHAGFRHFPRIAIVPVYVPYYPSPYFYDYEEPQRYEQPQPQIIERQVIIREVPAGSSEYDSRYGEHYFDSREEARRGHAPVTEQAPAAPAQQPAKTEEKPQELPATTLIYRDGHRSEVRSYAIVGENLIDLSKSPLLKKIPLASLDLDATRHENEENGVDFHLPGDKVLSF